ncbi:hypothetical protein LXL04_011909 [Taraxacum kok-saghyz]
MLSNDLMEELQPLNLSPFSNLWRWPLDGMGDLAMAYARLLRNSFCFCDEINFEVGESSSTTSHLRRSRRNGYEVVPDFMSASSTVADVPSPVVGHRRRRVSRRSGYELLPEFVSELPNSSATNLVNVSKPSHNDRLPVCQSSEPITDEVS